jgi:hypothetical protein
MLINIYLVEAPFQLVSAVAHKKANPNQPAWLFVRKSSSDRNNQQLIGLLQETIFSSPWKKIVYLDGSSPWRLALASVKLLACLLPVFSCINKFSIGDFRSRFAIGLVDKLKFNELCLLDDGVASLGLYSSSSTEITPSSLDDNTSQALLALKALKAKLSSKSVESKLTVSTFLSLPKSRDWHVEKVDLSFIFDQFRVHSQSIDNSLVYLVGSKVVETGILDAATYDAFCQKVRNDKPTAKIIYIAHREEEAEKLKKYESELGFDVSRPEVPLEFLLCNLKTLPSSVISLYSAALFTSRLIEPRLEVVSYVLKSTDVPEKYSKVISSCYCYLKADENITLIELSE